MDLNATLPIYTQRFSFKTSIMKKLISLSAAYFFSLIFFTSCGPTLTVTNDYDHTANFSQYHTFKIVKLEQQYQALSQLNQNRVIDAVQAANDCERIYRSRKC